MTPSARPTAQTGGRCYCEVLRQATRRVTQIYDDALGPTGLTITSYGLLARIQALGCPSMNELATASAMDRTTLSRNLKPLLDRKLVAVSHGEDRRRKEFRLTRPGRTMLAKAQPLWQRAQVQFRQRFGEANSHTLVSLLKRVSAFPR